MKPFSHPAIRCGLAALTILSGCNRDEAKETSRKESRSSPPRREDQGTRRAAEGRLGSEEKQDFENRLQGMEVNRGRFLDAYFSESPLDPFFEKMLPEELEEILGRHRFEKGSEDERLILKHYVAAKALRDPQPCVRLLMERKDPALANLCLGPIAEQHPEEAMKVLDAVIGKGSLRAVALGNLFNAAARGDLERAIRLVDTLESPRERGAAAIELLGSNDVTMVPFTTIAPLILRNEAAFAGDDQVFAVQAIRSHPVKEVVKAFDMGSGWQRDIVLAYLVDRGRMEKQDVKDYLDAGAGQSTFSPEERQSVIDAFGSNKIRPAHGHH